MESGINISQKITNIWAVKLYRNIPHYNILQYVNPVCLVLMTIEAKVSELFKKNRSTHASVYLRMCIS